MRYEVDIVNNGITSAVDRIEAPDDYSSEDYLIDCNDNGDDEWNVMLATVNNVILIKEE